MTTQRYTTNILGGESKNVAGIEVPPDLKAALKKAGVNTAFERAAPSRRNEWVRQVEEAKALETRERRIDKVIDQLSD
jgi:uncharacterized protein YdeI (YjbR/CyaY-like superfamily)